MQGIQHLFRQSALEKDSSMDSSWHSAQTALANQAYLQHHYASGSRPNDRSLSVDSNGDFRPSSWNQGEFFESVSPLIPSLISNSNFRQNSR